MKKAAPSSPESLAHVEEVDWTALTPDDHNANRGTVRGRYQIEKSIETHGFLEAGTLDADNRLIGGNKRTEVAHEIGLGNPLIIDIDGTRPVYLRRKDIKLDTPQGRAAAVALNRTAQTSIDLDPEVLKEFEAMGADLTPSYFPGELDEMLAALGKLATGAKSKDSAAEGDNSNHSVPERFLIIVTCASDSQQAELLGRLTDEGFDCRALVS